MGPPPGGRWEISLRKSGFDPIAGVDEAGRGCLAGPVVAAAVVLPPGVRLRGLRDSKLLFFEEREALYDVILSRAEDVAWAWAGPRAIDRINILQASFLAMRRALARLRRPPAAVLVDGHMTIPQLGCTQQTLVDGDARCRSIAAASVVAKVVRDRLMARCHEVFPSYAFDMNKGYGTPQHLEALTLHGPTPLHRFSFEPVAMTRQKELFGPCADVRSKTSLAAPDSALEATTGRS